MAIQNWPKTNTSGDWASVDGIVWAENQAANTVNDSARAMGRDLAKWHGDNNATLSTGGSSNAYTLTSNGSYASLANGFCVAVKANHSNTGAATLNVDSLGARAIRKFTGSGEAVLSANDIVNGGHYILQYNTAANSGAGGWIVLNPNQVATGDIADSAVTTAKIADDAVTAAKIVANAVGSSELADNAVDTAAIAANAVTAAKIERNANTGFILRSNGSGSDASFSVQVTLGTAQASTSGTNIDFTGIPSWARRVTVNFSGVSTNGTNSVGIQLGDSGGFETTGYLGAVFDGSSNANFSASFIDNTASATTVRHGSIVLTLIDAATFLWACSGTIGFSSAAAGRFLSGTKALSAALDRVRVTAGGDTFDAGTINIMYE